MHVAGGFHHPRMHSSAAELSPPTGVRSFSSWPASSPIHMWRHVRGESGVGKACSFFLRILGTVRVPVSGSVGRRAFPHGSFFRVQPASKEEI